MTNQPMKILIIKLGALGDVLRTTPLLTALRKKYPACHVTWIVDRVHRAVLEANSQIDRLLDVSVETAAWLKSEHFNLAVNLDKEPEATALLQVSRADKKMGFALGPEGSLVPADPLSEYAFRLGVEDELKFRQNQKTYQQISFEQVGLQFQKEEYVFSVPEKDASAVEEYLAKIGSPLDSLRHPVIVLNTGSGERFAGKKLPIESFVKLAEKFHTELKATVLLLGGNDEIDRNFVIQRTAGVPVVNTGSHSIFGFAALVRACDAVVTGDTTAMHIAIAVKTPVMAYFASTCAQEIEMYGRGQKIVSGISCAPCYKKYCPIDEQCMKDMSVDTIFDKTRVLLGAKYATRLS